MEVIATVSVGLGSIVIAIYLHLLDHSGPNDPWPLGLFITAATMFFGALLAAFLKARQDQKDRAIREKRDAERHKSEIEAFQRFLEMSRPESGTSPIYAIDAQHRAQEKNARTKDASA